MEILHHIWCIIKVGPLELWGEEEAYAGRLMQGAAPYSKSLFVLFSVLKLKV